MGCCFSQDAERLPDVEQQLVDAKKQEMRHFKVLLLGAGESGKSTVIKQLKLVQKVTMDEAELQNYVVTLNSNAHQCMAALVDAAQTFEYEFPSDLEASATLVSEFKMDNEKRLPPELVDAISNLWASEVIKKTWERRSEYWVLDTAEYYFEHVARFSEADCKPTEEDIIMARIRTSGVVVTEFDEGPIHFSVVDVGGQRNERKKWIHCFDDVKALLFIVNLAGYDQVMFEDSSKVRMVEELDLFASVLTNKAFQSIPIFLFLNKKDLFETMIRTRELSKNFPDYTGGPDTTAALDYIRNAFLSRMPSNGAGKLHTNYIAARFKKDIKWAWEDVKEILFEDNQQLLKQIARQDKKDERDALSRMQKAQPVVKLLCDDSSSDADVALL